MLHLQEKVKVRGEVVKAVSILIWILHGPEITHLDDQKNEGICGECID